ncbi:MAG: 2-C-methyl-D-erythritol 4-phosphate cytidylyltransferase [Calditrichia bacterium]
MKKSADHPAENMTVLITAAGRGTRFGGDINKQFTVLAGRPILAWTIEAFHRLDWIENILLVVPEDWLEFVAVDIVDKFRFEKICKIIAGGKERQDSVYAGLQALEPSCEWVMIHDGVRLFIREKTVRAVFEEALKNDAAIVGFPSRDTIKRAGDSAVTGTEDRRHLWLVQTPQVFRLSLIREAYQKAIRDRLLQTDDAGLVEHLGRSVKLVEGDYFNIKITTPEDIRAAEKLLPLYFQNPGTTSPK